MERERLDEQEAFIHLRRAARSSGRKLSEVAGEVAAGQPLPRGRTRPTSTQTEWPRASEEKAISQAAAATAIGMARREWLHRWAARADEDSSGVVGAGRGRLGLALGCE